MERSFLSWIILIIQNNWQAFLRGTGITLFIALGSTIIGFLIGILFSIIRTSPRGENKFKNWILSALNGFVLVYVEIFRGTPMMVQAIIIYFGILQEWLKLEVNPTAAGLIIVSINTGAYLTEVVRGGIKSVDSGQMLAAKSLGMTHMQAMFSIILPQAIRNIMPAVGNELIVNIKDTSVLNVITVAELFYVAKVVRGESYRTYEVFVVTAFIYLFLTFVLSRILHYIEDKWGKPKNFKVMKSATILVPSRVVSKRKRSSK